MMGLFACIAVLPQSCSMCVVASISGHQETVPSTAFPAGSIGDKAQCQLRQLTFNETLFTDTLHQHTSHMLARDTRSPHFTHRDPHRPTHCCSISAVSVVCSCCGCSF